MLSTVEDLFPESGPLGGIYTGLEAISAPYGVVVACDMPLLQPALLRKLLCLGSKHNLVVPVNDDRPEPLCAVYARACIEPLRSRLEAGDFRVTSFVEAAGAHFLRPEEWRPFDAGGLSFKNLNRQSDLQSIEALLRSRPSGT